MHITSSHSLTSGKENVKKGLILKDTENKIFLLTPLNFLPVIRHKDKVYKMLYIFYVN